MKPKKLSRILDIDPLAAAAGLARRPGTLLLHTQRPWAGTGRSVLLFDPAWVLRVDPAGPPRWRGRVPAPEPPDLEPSMLPLALARQLPRVDRRGPGPGLAGFLGYELGSRSIGLPPREHPLPDLWLGLYEAALVFEPEAPPRLELVDLEPLAVATTPLEERAARAASLLAEAASIAPPPRGGRTEAPTGLDPAWHRRAVLRIHEHLRRGDVYQVNLTGFRRARSTVDPWVAFLAQAHPNPVAFAAYLRLDDATVVSHSPERLLRLRGELAETAPIKGTAPTGLLEQLRASEKDRAEHVMIVDLCRNDLGRAARYGSVRVEELMAPLELRGLVHLVSRITARVPRAHRPRLLASLFPGGSITGAPKRRAMEIIHALEPEARGPYTGSFGYAAAGGDADWNIAIRTAVWQNGRVSFGCGGGIVLDSDPDAEHREALLKAASFFQTLQALGDAPAGAPERIAHAGRSER